MSHKKWCRVYVFSCIDDKVSKLFLENSRVSSLITAKDFVHHSKDMSELPFRSLWSRFGKEIRDIDNVIYNCRYYPKLVKDIVSSFYVKSCDKPLLKMMEDINTTCFTPELVESARHLLLSGKVDVGPIWKAQWCLIHRKPAGCICPEGFLDYSQESLTD